MLTNQSITKPIYIFVSHHHHHKLPHTFLLVIMSLGNNSELYLVTACGFQPKIGAFFGGFYKLTETTQNIWNICKHKKLSVRNSENLSLELKLNIKTKWKAWKDLRKKLVSLEFEHSSISYKSTKTIICRKKWPQLWNGALLTLCWYSQNVFDNHTINFFVIKQLEM